MPTDHRNVHTDRTVILDTGSSDAPRARRWWRRPGPVLAAATAGLLAAGGLAAGSWSIWSAVSGTEPAETPAPLWFTPPAPVFPLEPSTAAGPPATTTSAIPAAEPSSPQ